MFFGILLFRRTFGCNFVKLSSILMLFGLFPMVFKVRESLFGVQFANFETVCFFFCYPVLETGCKPVLFTHNLVNLSDGVLLKSKCVFYNWFFVLTIAAEHCSETAHQHGFHFPAIFRNRGYGRTAVRIRICYGSRNTSKSGFYFAINNILIINYYNCY